MPVILRFKGYIFFFYSNEGNPLEPAHIHIRNAESEAKFWLEPEISLARNDGFNSKELREIFSIIESNQKQFKEAWYDYFG
ncbi:DUF4160 domain-containing protein [Aggregatibacter actinomycetemcomitans]|uniref:DUF4160 domain-containing protein n=2 Tax=Aggregatibacter actinomycetemcomitans TaxID=714 RepID=A0A142FZ39_AGGAC|nr:DUF4160 domain-containing protein [Aggregatibacter actinomycetemcomitans]AFI87579.1 hypothetical protein D7S_01852 [Aggregatibacter actinomycetemcomitans D7S-1]AMQ93669.1 hypothetical protein ACT75_03595 [Aggregatibacter actinomycetemcomitans]ANU81249.1 hypothetical protein BBH51_00500 [Aggregatibacter actinomycetemcomitans]EKX97629.1 hypothetical protein HMPREF9996_00867 [Aggregatibacter actinomycetemcomitans Y4]KND82929.1 hypothetical protein H5P1_0210315 [Aggregatibacter actinomycetemcom